MYIFIQPFLRGPVMSCYSVKQLQIKPVAVPMSQLLWSTAYFEGGRKGNWV